MQALSSASGQTPKLCFGQLAGRNRMTRAACTKSMRKYPLPRLVMPPEDRFGLRSTSAWDEPDPCRKIPASGERRAVADRCNYRTQDPKPSSLLLFERFRLNNAGVDAL